ncbi:MAG: MATE family efflux transporter [Leptolyngbyaceae cyanobacterium CSU_1_3]|nr:MATE family efflux transporter [Leptolyngbyaceae cyanobacterium CSU_1_3]
MVPLAGWMDVAFLGHLSEIHHLAGVALATVLFNYIYWTFGFLRMGTTGMTAQAVGRDDADAILLIGLRNATVAIGLGMMILLLQSPIKMIGFTLLSATAEVKASGQIFYNALIWGAPATLLNFVLIGWLLGQSQSAQVLLLSIVGNLSNVGLDYLLIVRSGWQSAGAGISTAISQYLMLVVGIILVGRKVQFSQIHRLAGQILNPAALKATLILNREILIRTFSLISTFAVFTNLSSMFGTEILSTNTLLLQVVTLAAYFIDGLAFAVETLAGELKGQQNFKELASLVKISVLTSLSLGLSFAITFIFFPVPLFGLLTHHAEILQQVKEYVRWLFPVLGFGSIAYLLDGYFLGLTEGRILRISVVTALAIGFVPMAIVACYSRNNHLLWLALGLFMACRATVLSIRLFQV